MLRSSSQFVFVFLIIASIFVTTAGADVQIMLTGEFHQQAIHKHDLKEFSGEWYAICQSDDRDSLKRVNIIVEPGTDVDGMSNVINNECDITLFLIRNLKGLSNRNLPRYEILQEEYSVTITSSKSSLTVKKVDLQEYAGFKLYTDYNGIIQQIYETPFIDESGWWELIWAGDINQDGIPDFTIKTSHKYSSYQLRLFLSDSKKGGAMFKEVAMIYIASAI